MFKSPTMFQPLSVFVGLRYVRSRQHKFFVSLITWVSLAGVSTGVAALIVVLSVMNGLGGELRTRLLSLGDHARIVQSGPAAQADNAALAVKLRALPGIVGVAPYTELQALAVRTPEMVPLTLRGIEPATEAKLSDLATLVEEGTLSTVQPGSNALLLGRVIADQLGAQVGAPLTIMVPVVDANGIPEPQEREFVVAGIFEAGIQDLDGTLALADLADVRALAPQAEGVSGLRLRFADPLAAPLIMPAVRALAGPGFLIRDWTQDNASYFRAIRIEKTMMALILLLIVGVAASNIVAMLMMVVNDKRTDIAILRTLGASPPRVLAVFVIQGLVIGWAGVLSGVALGVVLAVNVTRIVPFLERLFRFQFLDSDVYYITQLPSDPHPRDIVWIGVAALLLTLVATLYPALRASRTSPADALRYE
ncbi:MAG TPA: lipoprotein-releasing ABC transporter permease subunit [Steroidobacteraceae bacterium]